MPDHEWLGAAAPRTLCGRSIPHNGTTGTVRMNRHNRPVGSWPGLLQSRGLPFNEDRVELINPYSP